MAHARTRSSFLNPLPPYRPPFRVHDDGALLLEHEIGGCYRERVLGDELVEPAVGSGRDALGKEVVRLEAASGRRLRNSAKLPETILDFFSTV